jgi:hypothetical protein
VCAKSQHDPRPHARAPLPPPQDTLSQTPGQYNQRYRRGEHPPHAVHAGVRETTATGENRTPGPHQKEGRTTAAFRKSCPLPPAPGAVFGSNAGQPAGNVRSRRAYSLRFSRPAGKSSAERKSVTSRPHENSRRACRCAQARASTQVLHGFRSGRPASLPKRHRRDPARSPNTPSQQTECEREQRKIGDGWLRSKIGGRAP